MKKLQAIVGPPTRDFSGTMTDLCFLLIVFFLIAAVFVSDSGLLLLLPEPEAKPQELGPDQVISLTIEADDSIKLNGVNISRATLPETLSAKFTAKPDLVLIVEPASDVRYEQVLSLLETARNAGARTFSVNTQDNAVPLQVGQP